MKVEDEYVWQNYTAEYTAQLKEIERDDDNVFFITNYTAENNVIDFHDNLHPNWKEIYQTVYELKPKTILEMGCGGCYHIKNVHTLLPEAKITGVDLLRTQLDFGRAFSKLPESIETYQLNCVQNKTQDQHEFVFSQAVVMHLSTENAVKMLANMRDSSPKYVMMVDGVKKQAGWYDMVKSVFGPEWEFTQPNKFIDNSILLIKK